jgi:HK97 family phage portal protein
MGELTLLGALQNAATRQKLLSAVPNRGGWRSVTEPFAGAWQMNVTETCGDLLCYPTLYACVMRIVTDMGKLPFGLQSEDDNGIWKRVSNPAYSPVLRKPNDYQTAQQFREAWMISKLTQGNAYILKRRDNRGVVTGLYVLDPCRVQPMVSETGAVYYQLQTDALNKLPQDYPAQNLVVPAREIIHDRCITLHHWLVGVPPLCAAHWPALKNLKILKSSAEFFGNNAQPGGILTAPAGMSETDAQTVRDYWNTNYTGANVGKVAVIGADMKFTAFAMKSADSQLVEQMRYSDEQICQPFGVPPFIIGMGQIPAGMKVDDMANMYYTFALQSHIESMEYLLDEGLGVSAPLGVVLDTEPLLRMDAEKRSVVYGKLVADGIATPNEGRREFNYPPLEGGDTVYMQQQDYPLDQVRQNKIAAPVPPAPPPQPEPDPEAEQQQRSMVAAAIAHAARKSLNTRLANVA